MHFLTGKRGIFKLAGRLPVCPNFRVLRYFPTSGNEETGNRIQNTGDRRQVIGFRLWG